MGEVLHDIGHAYDSAIVDTGRQPELFLLLAFLLSFGFIRTSAHLIRSQRFSWWPGNVDMGGTHVHHLVWGILALLVIGYCGIAFEPHSPLREILAILFGVGAGLTLDEFALWLNLEDVYWTQKGRRSIDAVIIAGICGGLVLLGLSIWVELAEDLVLVEASVVGFGTVAIALAMVNVLKGKVATGAIGLVVPVVGPASALRLAQPGSVWARFYGEPKMARARARFSGTGRRLGPIRLPV
jgi:hypothetical protein